MASCAEQVKSCLVEVLEGRPMPRSGIARGLRRLAASALKAAYGGREPGKDDVEDLVQEFLVKTLVLRTQRGPGVLAKEWAAMPASKLVAYVRTTLKNLAVEQNPAWDTQRALRDVVKAALAKGLPAASGLPASIEKNGRFVRPLVAAACAELVGRGTPAECGALTSALMAEYALGVSMGVEDETFEIAAPTPTALDDLAVQAGGASLAAEIEKALGPESLEVLKARRGGVGAVVARFGMKLKTAYARCAAAEKALVKVVRREGSSADEVKLALGMLEVVSAV